MSEAQNSHFNKMKRGFTLIEIMVAVSIFIMVMTISMGSIIGIFDVNRKSHSLKTAMTNLNLAVESMSREIRFGKNYHCCTDNTCSETLTTVRNCPLGSAGISFLSSDNQQIVYRLNAGVIQKSDNGGTSYIAITSPEVTINDLSFYVLGAGGLSTNTLQPKTLVKIKGQSGNINKGGSNFSLQTMVSQRALDI
jgi:prepilin-type N-terminal cleavage/methylation domain-containing protein